jgi:hypothetical protein
MPTKRLYLQPIPEGAQLEDRDDLRSNISNLGLLDGGTSSNQVSQLPGDHILRGQYRCQSAEFAELMAQELRELGNSSGFDAVPLYRTDTGAGKYYIVENVDEIGPLEPQEPAIQQFRLSLSEAGTKKNRWRAVSTAVSSPTPVHPFGVDERALVGIPTAASKVEAIKAVRSPTEREIPTVDETNAGAFGDVDLYDVTEISFDNPILLYELDYETVGVMDPVVWDTRGHSDKQGSDQIRQWQHVFDPAHDIDAPIVLENGLLRVRLDESAGTVTAEVYSDGSYSSGVYSAGTYGGETGWQSLTLGDPDPWQLRDIDLMRIGPTRVDAQLEFVDDAGDLFAVDVTLGRGRPRLAVWLPRTVEEPIPAGIESLFDPIASASIYTTGSEQTLIARKEVRR